MSNVEMETPMMRVSVWVYETCRSEAMASRRPIVPEQWIRRTIVFRRQFIATIERLMAPGALEATSPEREHQSWVQAYVDMGWKYGPVRNQAEKTHPDLLPFADLPKAEQDKDAVFLALCRIARDFIIPAIQ